LGPTIGFGPRRSGFFFFFFFFLKMASPQSMDVLDDTTKDMEMELTVDAEPTPGSPDVSFGVESFSSTARPVLSRSFYLGATYAIVLCGYYTANSFVSVLYQKVYFIGWSLLYFFYFVASFVGPSLRLPIKPTMAGCAVVYVLYIAAINLGQDVVFLISSRLCFWREGRFCFFTLCSIVGVTAGLFWLKSSEWISLESKRQNGGAEGALTGAFYGVFYFQVCEKSIYVCVFRSNFFEQGILGCGIALFILMFQADISLLIWCMCGLTGVGLVMTLFVPNVESDAQTTVKPPSLKEKVLLLLKSASQRSVLFMIPMIFLQSAQVCFSYQFLPRLVRASTTEAIFPFVNVSTFFVYWVASIVVSFSYGKLFDKFGWKVVLAVRGRKQKSVFLLLPFVLFKVRVCH
jgi:hypothetical protein